MMEFIMTLLTQQINLAAIIVLIVFLFILLAMFTMRHTFSCMDLITSPDGRLSRTAMGQTLGIVVAVWLPIQASMSGKADAVLTGVCLGYLGLVEGYAKFLRWKADRQDKGADQ